MAFIQSLITKIETDAQADAKYLSEQRQAQAKVIKVTKQAQIRSYTSKRVGYCKALPMSVLTPKASESRWALLQKGTDSSRARTVSRLDAKHKSSTMPDPVTMHELNRKIALVTVNQNCIKLGRATEWFTKHGDRLTAKQRRTLRHLINQSYQDGAEMMIAQLGGTLPTR